MVFESVAEIILSKFLDKIFYGISKNNIQVAFLDGKFVLSNIGLQPSFLAKMNLPVQLKYSYVQKLQINLPWRSEEVSITINISNIYVLVSSAENSIDLYDIFVKRKEKVIEQALKEFKSHQQKKNNKKQSSFIEKIFLNLLDNVNIKIQCIHFRYENINKNYSFGIKINEVSAKTVDQHDQPQFFNRQKTTQQYVRYNLEMDFMGIYFNSKEDHFLSNLSLAEITDQFNRLSHKRYRNYSQNFDSEELSDNFHYILTISLKTAIKKYINILQKLNDDNAKEKQSFQCIINLNKIQSNVSDQQYYDILDVIGFFSDYQKTYQQFVDHWHLINYKQRKAKDISDLLKKKKNMNIGKKEKQTLKRSCRKYLSWIFKHTYSQVLKRTFIQQVIRKEINVKNITENPKALAIMCKIDNQKLKLWILISLYYRKLYQEKVSVFFRRSTDKMNSFANQNIKKVSFFSPYQFQQQIIKQRQKESQYQVFLKVMISIKQLNFEISRQNTLGVSFNIQKLKAEFILKEKSFIIKTSMEDLSANVFNCKKYQKLKTYVPIIKRNCILDRNVNLLEMTYQRNPVGRPFVFTEIQSHFESIQITIYPEAFKQFYQILLGDGESQKKKKKKTGKRKEIQQQQSTVRQIGFQKTIIKGKVRSPWVVLPLSPINNPAQECWVVRLGDFYVDTPQHDFLQVKTQEQIYYEQYKLELKRFQLSYFSSINFFHNWLKFNYSLESLYKIKAFANEKIITMIQPLSCFVQLSLLKSTNSPAIKDRKVKLIAKIMIDQIEIRVSKFLLTRLKYRFDKFDENQELKQFIETNVLNIKQQNDLCGYSKISYEGIKKMTFYCILKGSYMYFFINQNHHKYHFLVNLNETAIRLVSNEVQNFNTEKSKMLCFYLGDREKHYHWRKKIIHIINKKDRRMDNTINFFRPGSIIQESKSSTKKDDLLQRQKEKQKQKEKQEQGQSSNLKLHMTFLMNKLSISLQDQLNARFLYCNFKKSTLQYSTATERSLKFSLNEWTVHECDDVLFISSTSFFEEQIESLENRNLNNFLQVLCGFNSITQQLKDIQIKVDKLFLAWKVELFTKILLFFFFDEQVGDAPSPINFDKRQLQIKISVQKFTFYCYFADELLALSKLQYIDIRYFQNNIEQIYDVKCKVFEIDKYVNGQKSKRMPIVRRRTLLTHIQDPVYNNFNLLYILRKKDTKQKKNIQRLKQKFGDEVLVSQITCDWKDTEIYFENQLTIRILNYILGKVLGTIASKFKKRQYSPNYIFQSLKICKLTVFDIALNNCVIRIPPHQRGFREFVLDVQQLLVLKNNQDSFMPTEVEVPTIKANQRFFWQSMVIKIKNAQMSYQVGNEPSIQILAAPISMNIVYSKLNFQREYFVILNHHDDINRKYVVDVIIEQPVLVQAHKIMFVTFLQIFYQNIKHRDGKADIFEPPLPFPSLREYNIYIQKVGLNMYYFHQKNNSMEVFSRSLVDRLKIVYNQIGQQSKIRLQGQSISSAGQLPIYSLQNKNKKFLLQMESQQGQMKLVITPQYYVLQANLDNINNIVQFINYDNDYVVNQLMPKKSSSWQIVNVFAKNCELRLGELRVTGEFYITYLKGMKNDPENDAKMYLLAEQQFEEVLKDPSKLNWDDITDKQIKVNGQDLNLSIEGDMIGGVTSFCFSRTDFSSKSTNRRYKRQKIQVSQGSLHIQLVDLQTIWKIYNTHIRKNPNYIVKNFFEPWDKLQTKTKSIQKRCTEVEIERIGINIISSLSADMLRYMRIDLQIPRIIYKTYLQQQEVLVNIRFQIAHQKQKMKELIVADCRSFKLRYLNIKDRRQKIIQILNAKGIAFNANDLNNAVISQMIRQIQQIKQTKRVNFHLNPFDGSKVSYRIIFKNQTSKKVKLRVNNLIEFNANPNNEENIQVQIQQIIQLLNNPKSFVQVHEEGFPSVRLNCSQLNIYKPNQVNNQSLCIMFNSKSTIFTFRPSFTLKNMSSGLIFLADKRQLRRYQSASITPDRHNLISLQLKVGNWFRKCDLDTTKQDQIIGDESFVVSLSKDQKNIAATLYDRFVIKNMLVTQLYLEGKQVPSFKEQALGYVSGGQREKYSIKTDNQIILNINLTKQNTNIEVQRKIATFTKNKSVFYTILKNEIRIQSNINNKIVTLSVYSRFSIKNECQRDIQFINNNNSYIISANSCTIVPFELSNIKFKEEQKYFDVLINKNKCFYSDFLKFTLIHRLKGKAAILKIQQRYSFINNSNQVIQVQAGHKKLQSIIANQMLPLHPKMIENHTIVLIFGKYHKRRIDLRKKGTNFLEMEELYFRLSVIEKEQSYIVLLEDSKAGHLIINKLDDITITCNSYQQPRKQSGISLYEINNDDSIQKLIKPHQQDHIGIFCWQNPKIQLQFYLQSKNIEFKQKYQLNFELINHKFSHKHVIHDQKNHKIIHILIITLQKDSQNRFTVTVYKERQFQNLAVQKMRVSIHQISIMLMFSSNQAESITFQCYKAVLVRQKGIELTDFDIQVDKLLVREGKNVSILNALNSSRFLNCHLITSKTIKGTGINNLMIKLAPFEIICKQKAIFKVLEKIVEIRIERTRRSTEQRQRKQESQDSLLKNVPQFEEISNQQSMKLSGQWQSQLSKQIKGPRLFIINNMQISETNIFLTYSKEEYKQFDQKIISDKIIKYMLLIPPISELKISISHLKLTQFEGQPKQLAKELLNHLKQSIGSTIANSFGSLPLFDSPIIAADGIFRYIDGMLSIQ